MKAQALNVERHIDLVSASWGLGQVPYIEQHLSAYPRMTCWVRPGFRNYLHVPRYGCNNNRRRPSSLRCMREAELILHG